jgi:hypothetical protein
MIARRLVLAALAMMLAGGWAVALSCSGPGSGPTALTIVRLDGATSCRNESQALLLFTMAEPGQKTVTVAAHDGDCLILNEFDLSIPGDKSKETDTREFLIYRASDGRTLTVGAEDGRALVGGKVVSACLKEEAQWQWLEKAPEAQLTGLRLVVVESAVTPPHLAALERLAKQNPNVDLRLEEMPEDQGAPASQVLQLFRPRLLTCMPAQLPDPKSLGPALANVEDLTIGQVNEKSRGFRLDFLAELPRLRSLAIGDGLMQQAAVLQSLKGLKSLRVMDDSLTDLAPLAQIKGLEFLSVSMNKKLSDLSPLAGCKNLRMLSLTGCEGVTDLAPLDGLRLVYLDLPPKLTQEQFNATLGKHTDLETLTLAIFGSHRVSNVKDLTALEALTRLRVLNLSGLEALPPSAAASLKKLKSLRVLVLPSEGFTPQSPEIADLRKALPDAVIEPGAGLCLGSGWILALVAAVAAAWGAKALRRRNRRATGGV